MMCGLHNESWILIHNWEFESQLQMGIMFEDFSMLLMFEISM